MSARQNIKKRKARNVINRERTVTTLTEGPESAFLVPTPTEEPAAVLMSAPFPLPSGVPPNMQPGFQISPNDFGHFPYNVNAPYLGPGPMGPHNYGQQHPTPHQFFHGQQPPLDSPMGEGDLEILENLKEKIKNGQHEVFKAVPNPTFLANLYMGPPKAPLVSQVPPHPEQVPTPSERNGPVASQAPAELAPSRGAMDTSSSAEAVPASKSTVAEARRTDNVLFIRVRSCPLLTDTRIEPPQSNAPAPTSKAPASNTERGPKVKQEVDDRLPPAPSRSQPQGLGKTQSDRSLADEPPLGTRGPGYSPTKPGLDNKDDQRLSRDHSWTHRNGVDDKPRYDADRNGRFNGDSRFNTRPDNRGPGFPSRHYDRDRDRKRSPERDRDHDRDRRPDFARFKDERRNDDRFRGPDNRRPLLEYRTADTYRPYERRPIDDVGAPLRTHPSDDRSHPDTRPPPRTLGEERAIIRGPADAPPTRTLPDDHRPPDAPSTDERRAPVPAPSERPPRDFEERRPLPPPVSSDRPLRGNEEHRASPPPANDKLLRSPEDRRPPPTGSYSERQTRPADDRRAPPLPPSSSERQVRPQDSPRGPLPLSSSVDRPIRPLYPPRPYSPAPRMNDDRRMPPPTPEDRGTRPGPPPSRPPPEERSLRPQPSKEDLSSRPPVSLEERISRLAPSLQERISTTAARPDDRLDRGQLPRLDERVSRPAPSLEERLSRAPPTTDDRTARPPATEDRATRPMPPPAATDRLARPAPSDDRAMLLAEPARPPLSGPPDRGPRPDDRGRPPVSNRFNRPGSPAADRGPGPRPGSVARDPPRKFEPPRSDILRPAGDPPPPRDRADIRPPYGGDRRPDIIDVDPPAPRFNASYRRPLEPYPPRGRAWPPTNDSYPEDPVRRPPPDARERGYPDDWESRNGRDWERPPPRDYERDRFADAPPAPGWETREEREHPAPAPRSSRLSEGYAPEDRSYGRDMDRPRYPPAPDTPPFSRIRPRSPSPLRRPVKRARDDAYGSGYYPPPPADTTPRAGPPQDYPPRGRTPPPVGGSAYYDDPRGPPYRSGPPPPLQRDREAPDVGGYSSYDRRDPPSRMLPPQPRYGRDERRYSVPPR
ncbi:uncharacterized protein B0H18DRAFT_986160 [Fomitopsis serialis]|uniref:uncharacterized protein n=1 Tax=Fomitopsis serialis TaxID=139415 RepID=UPI002008354A|nr:uncharacterized protein B0H18DRAFT_986160 [Neoantrodia serialis]KAH9932548.1 hypothetical protein B0H18DRAFT_986160 [Neoantrodia serialis]